MTAIAFSGFKSVPPHFGMRPPKLFTPLTDEEKKRYSECEPWVDPDGEWIHAKPHNIVPPEEIDRVIFETPRGALYMLPLVGFRELASHIGWRKAGQVISEFGGRRTFLELVKYMFKDPYQHYWPIRVNDHWAHMHDAMHMEVSRLRPIRMGKTEGVNGIDGHSYKVVPLFHKDDPDYKAKYNGMLDEYRVAIHVACKCPSLFNTMRVLYYAVRFIREVPNPLEVIREHKKTMKEAGLTFGQPEPDYPRSLLALRAGCEEKADNDNDPKAPRLDITDGESADTWRKKQKKAG